MKISTYYIFFFTVMIGAICSAVGIKANAAPVNISVEGGSISLTPSGRDNLRSWTEGSIKRGPTLEHPDSLKDALDGLWECTTTLEGWSKPAFIQEWEAAEEDIGSKLVRLVKDGKSLAAGPPISPEQSEHLARQAESNNSLSPEMNDFLQDLRDRSIDVTVLHVEGIPGEWVIDPSVDNSSALPSSDQIALSAERFILLSVADLYERLSMTPEACYTEQQIQAIKSVIGIAGDREALVSEIYGGQDVVEIECGKVGTYSRFRIPSEYLSEPVSTALEHGPWPFGPAGYYFARDWFYANAVWQMYAREGGDWAANLTADVADYSCGPP